MLNEVKEGKGLKQSDTYINKPSLMYSVIKRLFDFVGALILSIIIIIPCLVVALIIVVVDPGNPFYAQTRVGKNGKLIKVYKFRSMKKSADEIENSLTPEQREQYEREYKIDNDPRLIGKGVGRFIRESSIDELPQIIINILILGNMSAVGPRPVLKQELESKYTEEQQKRFVSVKPGLTGYWQAYGRNNITYDSGKRQEMELYYADNASLRLDFKILCKTVVSVIKKDGAM